MQIYIEINMPKICIPGKNFRYGSSFFLPEIRKIRQEKPLKGIYLVRFM